jgi:AAA domain, putative AbiEii toxin, Type IV TA system
MGEKQKKAASVRQRQLRLQQLSSRLMSVGKEVGRINAEIQSELAAVGIENTHAFELKIPDAYQPIVEARKQELAAELLSIEGDANAPTQGTVHFIQREISQLEAKTTADSARRERIQVIQRRIAGIDTEIDRLRAEIATIETTERDRLMAAKAERIDSYLDFFENLKSEQVILEELYQPVRERLSSGSEQEQALDFVIRWDVQLSRWLERGISLYDQRKSLPFGDVSGMETAARQYLVPGWISGNADQIRQGMEEFLKGINDSKAIASLRPSAKGPELLEWLLDVDHIQLRYGLRYNGVELEKLSPGTKGIVLLILYLGMDQDDTRPLIIDQPEENLDSESVYNLLSGYFRKAKRRRQIILITHNPNLVVNTDAEQVVVAQSNRRTGGLPTIRYVSGAIENTAPTTPGIRQQICRILEGGERAFQKRERRYALSAWAV